MVRTSDKRRASLFVALLPLVSACGHSVKSVAPASLVAPAVAVSQGASSVPPPAVVQPAVQDPVLTLIEASNGYFKAGQRELELGHVGGARQQFDHSVQVLLESAYGGRTEPRIREHFDRLVDRISAYEVKALAQGDGFTEQHYEPAVIDDLLALSATFGERLATPELQNAVATDLQLAGHDLPIPLNQRVLAFIELFQGRLHDFIEDGLNRGSKYLPMIQNVFRAEGLPLDLAYVPLIESAFKPNALSKAKAKGVWQFMRGTGLENGLRQDWYIDERADPEKATVAAAKYLGTLGHLFDGDWHLALASYNGGPGRVQRAMKTGRANDFWALSDKPRLLPRETRDYVPMILAAVVIARNPAQYGFEVESAAVSASETVVLQQPVDLRHIAEWADTTIDEIRSLNPELRRWTTPVSDTSYELRVPVGKAEVIGARLGESSTNDLASLRWYTVRKGESLPTIAKKLNVSRTDLAEANYLRTTAKVAPGQKLMVPQQATVLMAARSDLAVPVADSRAILTDTDAVVPALTGGTERMKVVYEVHQGDTLASIAHLFKTTVSSLQSWNRISGTQIRAGARLTIYKVRAD